MLWKTGLRKLLFCLPPERAHYLSMGAFDLACLSPAVGLLRRRYSVTDPRLSQRLFGLNFKNPVGLAAGFDKDARWFHKLAGLGFSHVEVGTITGQPQPGNPQPRLFRLPSDFAIINRMGFNNHGADAAARRLARVKKSAPDDILGINIGKTKVVPLEDATDDYRFSFERLFDFADYFTINVSSPNTPGLRELQNRDSLLELLQALTALNHRLADDHETSPKPILLKIAPDLSDDQLGDITHLLQVTKIAGVIATNTTISRDGLVTPLATLNEIGNGGLSGAPLTVRSREVVARIFRDLDGKIPIIGVGGIMNGEDAWQMILAGASLVQIYTGFIYGGPGIVRDINRYLQAKIEHHQLNDISDAIGGTWNGSKLD
jgi:dihydroorotate dehydrogenase